jgi:hypothetical protein
LKSTTVVKARAAIQDMKHFWRATSNENLASKFIDRREHTLQKVVNLEIVKTVCIEKMNGDLLAEKIYIMTSSADDRWQQVKRKVDVIVSQGGIVGSLVPEYYCVW